MKTYDVLRQHLGDKQYWAGETREANEADVKHLVEKGILKEAKGKAESPAANKAVKAAPKNKSA